jgi:hypothetical protein
MKRTTDKLSKSLGIGRKYNAAAWRIDATGKPISVVAVEFVNGKVHSVAGHFANLQGVTYHERFLQDRGSFCGEPCQIVVTDDPNAVLHAMRGSFGEVFLRSTVLATF